MARARVWAGREFQPGRRTWYYEVYDSAGNLVLQDNTGSWRKVYDTAHSEVNHIKRMEIGGHTFKTPKWMKR